jgi:hypothetical protein
MESVILVQDRSNGDVVNLLMTVRSLHKAAGNALLKLLGSNRSALVTHNF